MQHACSDAEGSARVCIGFEAHVLHGCVHLDASSAARQQVDHILAAHGPDASVLCHISMTAAHLVDGPAGAQRHIQRSNCEGRIGAGGEAAATTLLQGAGLRVEHQMTLLASRLSIHHAMSPERL
jgi:hypothetical protein